ncbi:MAG: hypothetical protein K6E85_15595 [Lachnospiraceae bacterium]|nr:hypothetical protein [Lachnospiraceae bacterium]
MKKLKLTLIFMIWLIFVCAFSMSCTSKEPPVVDPDITQQPIDEKDDPKATSYEVLNNPEVTKIGYYSVDSTGKIKRATSLVVNSASITPELILSYFVDSLEDESIELSIDNVTVENNICKISFDDSIKDVASMGKNVETAVLDAAAQSILDNIDDVTGVSFCIKGEKYWTKNYTFTLNSIYMGK